MTTLERDVWEILTLRTVIFLESNIYITRLSRTIDSFTRIVGLSSYRNLDRESSD